MIADTINSALLSVWTNFVHYATLQFVDIDPFWRYLVIGIVISLIAAAISHFLSPWIPALRPVAGIIILLITFGLFTYRKGGNDARARIERRKPPPPKPKPPPGTWPPFGR